MHRRIVMKQMMLMAVLAAIIGGCDTNNMDVRKQYPDWPKWGWWERPAVADDETADESGKKEIADGRPDTEAERVELEESGKVKPIRKLTPLPDATITKEQLSKKIQFLEQHREKVWRSVSMLREIDTLPLSEQNELRRKILENLDQWYEPMPVSPPNTKKPDWTDTVIWDFMPSPMFCDAVNRWETIAQKNNLKFPANPSRRELLQYINDYVEGKLKPDRLRK